MAMTSPTTLLGINAVWMYSFPLSYHPTSFSSKLNATWRWYLVTAATEYIIGQEILRDRVRWLVTRIVKEDTALVINEDGHESVTTESYVMLKSELGEIDFIVLLHNSLDFVTKPERKIPS